MKRCFTKGAAEASVLMHCLWQSFFPRSTGKLSCISTISHGDGSIIHTSGCCCQPVLGMHVLCSSNIGIQLLAGQIYAHTLSCFSNPQIQEWNELNAWVRVIFCLCALSSQLCVLVQGKTTGPTQSNSQHRVNPGHAFKSTKLLRPVLMLRLHSCMPSHSPGTILNLAINEHENNRYAIS